MAHSRDLLAGVPGISESGHDQTARVPADKLKSAKEILVKLDPGGLDQARLNLRALCSRR